MIETSGIRPVGRTVILLLAVLAAGCAAIRNTPQQDLAWERWSQCRAEVYTANLVTVDPSGRIRFEVVTGVERDRMLGCLAALNASGPTLPDPIVEFQRRGP